MHESVFKGIASERLKGYAVWEPILFTDNEGSAREAIAILPDARVRHYWIDGKGVGELFQAAIDLEGEAAWDVYLVYPPGVEWNESVPPRPTSFMHQLWELPDDRRLNADTLAIRLRDLAVR